MTLVNDEKIKIHEYERGMKAMEENDFDTAINNFQECMKKLSSQGLGLTSDLFPTCLQNIASCYSQKDDMENALSFKKFEKLYYETILLQNEVDGTTTKESNDDANFETTRDRGDGSSAASARESTFDLADENKNCLENETAKKAAEYEQLAKFCLQQECVSLALEYSGKATLLHRHHYGDDHEKTKKSFKYFTTVYAEAGKAQYSESMDQANLEVDDTISSPAVVEETLLRHRKNIAKDACKAGENGRSKPLKRTRSILKRKASGDSVTQSGNSQPEAQRRVTFAEPMPQMVRFREEDENDNLATNLLLFFLICVMVILVGFLLSALVCHFTPTWSVCVRFRRQITHFHTKARYVLRSVLP